MSEVQVEVKAEDNKTTTQSPEVSKNESVTQPNISPENDVNWKKFREDRERERKDKDEAVKRAAEKEAEAQALKAAMESLLNRGQQQQQSHQQDQYQEESEEQRIEKHVAAALAKRDQEYERQRQERERAETPQRLAQTFQDFDQVCNTSNLDYLEYHYPEVANAYKYMPDGFDKWQSIYKAVKRFVPNTDSAKESKKAEANFNKPQSISSPGVTQGGNAMPAQRLDEAKKAQNWERMQRLMNKI